MPLRRGCSHDRRSAPSELRLAADQPFDLVDAGLHALQPDLDPRQPVGLRRRRFPRPLERIDALGQAGRPLHQARRLDDDGEKERERNALV